MGSNGGGSGMIYPSQSSSPGRYTGAASEKLTTASVESKSNLLLKEDIFVNKTNKKRTKSKV